MGPKRQSNSTSENPSAATASSTFPAPQPRKVIFKRNIPTNIKSKKAVNTTITVSLDPNKPEEKAQSIIKKNEEIEIEYNSYCSIIRELVSLLPEDSQDKIKVAKWTHLLVNPLNAAQPIEIREKRNQYLFIITCGLLTGNTGNFLKIAKQKHLKADQSKKSKFRKVAGMKGGTIAPPKPTIADENGFPHSLKDALDPLKLANVDDLHWSAEWENSMFWDRRLQTISDSENAIKKSSNLRGASKAIPVFSAKICSVHGTSDNCPNDLKDTKIGRCLDRQFEYLLALCEFYKDAFHNEAEKITRINLWLQAMAKIDKTYCAQMKGIRNDYAMVLVGYLVDGAIRGPFEELPPDTLQPLVKAVATYLSNRKIEPTDGFEVPLNPASDTIENFLNTVPKIQEGAFALLSLNGNVLKSKLLS